MADTLNVRPAPFGAITIFRATTALTVAADRVRHLLSRRSTMLSDFSPAELEDIGLSVADLPDDRAGMFSALVKAVRTSHDRRQTAMQLRRLSDAQLDDIGMTRFDIDELVYGRKSR